VCHSPFPFQNAPGRFILSVNRGPLPRRSAIRPRRAFARPRLRAALPRFSAWLVILCNSLGQIQTKVLKRSRARRVAGRSVAQRMRRAAGCAWRSPAAWSVPAAEGGRTRHAAPAGPREEGVRALRTGDGVRSHLPRSRAVSSTAGSSFGRKVPWKFLALPGMAVNGVPGVSVCPGSEDAVPCGRGASGLDSFSTGVKPGRFQVLHEGAAPRGGAFTTPSCSRCTRFAVVGQVLLGVRCVSSTHVCEQQGAKQPEEPKRWKGRLDTSGNFHFCFLYVFPQMIFSSNQFGLEDAVLLGGLRAVARRRGLRGPRALPRSERGAGVGAARGGGAGGGTGVWRRGRA